MDQSAIEYYTVREQLARAAAAAASDPRVAEVHLEMAERYADRLWSEMEKAPQPLPVAFARFA